MSDDRFFERVRSDAAPLRYEPDAIAMSRMAARIREQIAEPQTVAQLLARWFRPLAAAVVAIGIVAGIGLVTIDEPASSYEPALEITMAGDVYRVD